VNLDGLPLEFRKRNADVLRREGLGDAPGFVRPDGETIPVKIEQERQLQRLCEQELSRRDCPYLHLSPRARERRGWPDLVFVWQRVPYAVELKSADGKLSLDQERMLRRMQRCGWVTMVVREFVAFAAIFKGGNHV